MGNNSSNALTRRAFMKSTAAVTATVGASCLTGSALADEAQGATDSSERDVWALEEVGEPTTVFDGYDVIIVGGGGTGLAAAIEADELGLKAVVLEKHMVLGGGYGGTEGLFALDSRLIRENGEPETVDEVVQRCMTFHHHVPNQELYRNFITESAETSYWLEDHGCMFNALRTFAGHNEWHTYSEEDGMSPGMHFTQCLIDAAQATGTEFMLSTPVKKILTDENGAVSGAIAVNDETGEIIQVNAPVVFLASGGYPSNEEFLRAVSPFARNRHILSLGPGGRDGDGMKMARALGADLAEGYGTVMWCGPVIIGTGWATPGYCAGVQPVLWVNQNARRFTNEDIWLNNFQGCGVVSRKQESMYLLFTEADIDAWDQQAPYINVFTIASTDAPLAGVREQIEGLDSVHVGDSIAELAQEVGLDPDALQQTVDRYNELCANGVDEDFGKDPAYMKPLETGPFWLCEVANGYYTTVGGIKVSGNLEVLDADEQPIVGLYAGGCDAGGLYGEAYGSPAPGACAGFAVNSGRMAMKYAVEFLGK